MMQDTNNKLNNSKKYTLIIGLILFIILIIIIVFFMNNDKKEVIDKLENSNINLTEKKEIKKSDIIFNKLPFIEYMNSSISIYNNEYVYYLNTLYDFDGKIILKNIKKINEYYFKEDVLDYYYDNNNLYNSKGKKIIKYNSSNDNIKIYNDYININNIIYDKNGTIIFNGSNYNSVEYFDDYFFVKKGSKFGIVDNNNKLLVDFKYDYINSYKEISTIILGKSGVRNGNNDAVYSIKYNKLYSSYYEIVPLNSEYAVVKKYSGKQNITGFINTKDVETFKLNLKTGEEKKLSNNISVSSMNPLIFNGKYVIADDLATTGGFIYGLYNDNLEKVLPIKYKTITPIGDKYLLLTSNGKQELVDINLKKFLEYESDKTSFLDKTITYDDYAIIVNVDDDKINVYNKSGKLILSTTGFVTYNYDKNYFIDDDKNNMCYYVDTNSANKKTIDYSYCDNAFYANGDYIISKKDNKYTVYNTSLEPVFKNTYDGIYLFDDFCIVKNDKYYNIMSYNEEKIIDKDFTAYESLYSYNNQVLLRDNEKNVYYFSINNE